MDKQHLGDTRNGLHKIIYTSSAVRRFTEEDFDTLCLEAIARNLSEKITGCLLYHDGNIIQYLEGPKIKVDETFNRIIKDSRHHNIILLYEDHILQRSFPKSSIFNLYLSKSCVNEYASPADLLLRYLGRNSYDTLCEEAKIFFCTFIGTAIGRNR